MRQHVDHETPPQKPTIHELRSKMDPKERHDFDGIQNGFQSGLFWGKLVIQWCGRCVSWRLHYVPKTKLDELAEAKRNRPYFMAKPDTFPCIKCKRKLIVNTDADHTLIENRP